MAIDEMGRSPIRGRRAGTSTALGLLLAGVLASATVALALATRLRAVLLDHTGPWRVDAAVETGVTGIGALVALWLTCSALLATACVAVRAGGATWRAGEQLVHRYAPQLVRKALVLALGAGLGLGMATGASAAAPVPGPSTSVGVGPAAPDDLGWVVTSTTTPTPPAATQETEEVTATASPSTPVPDEPVVVAPEASTPGSGGPAAPPAGDAVLTGAPAAAPLPPAAAPAGTVVVGAGDSLWAIAARHLPPGATDAEIAAAWPRWYDANAAVVGADPDVIRPGQVLTVPAADGKSR